MRGVRLVESGWVVIGKEESDASTALVDVSMNLHQRVVPSPLFVSEMAMCLVGSTGPKRGVGSHLCGYESLLAA